MSKCTDFIAFILGLAILAAGLIGCPAGDSGTDPSPRGGLSRIEVQAPNQTDYFWGEAFNSKGMSITLQYKDGSEAVLEFTTVDAFTKVEQTQDEPAKLRRKEEKDGYTIDLRGFVNDKGVYNLGNNLAVTVSVKIDNEGNEPAKSAVFYVNVVPFDRIIVTTDPKNKSAQHYYLGQKLPSGNEIKNTAGLTVQGKFGNIIKEIPYERLSVEFVANGEVSESQYVNVGGKQELQVSVTGFSLAEGLRSYRIPITVHILDYDPDPDKNKKNYAGEEYGVKYIDMATIPGLTSHNVNAIGSGPFSVAGLKTIQAFELGQYEVTYELWYAVYKWAIAQKNPNGTQMYQFSDWDTSRLTHMGLGITEQDGKKGAPPPDDEVTRYKPVHDINWADAIVWCNAFHELLHEIRNTGKELDPLTFPYLLSNVPVKDSKQVVENNKDVKVTFNQSSSAFRLPSETEWEFAARGAAPSTEKGTPWQSKYAGGDSVADVAWRDGVHSPKENKKAVAFTPSGPDSQKVELYNMSGNVWEWCQSNDSYPKQEPYYLKRGGAYNSTMPDPNNPNDKTTDYLANNSSRDSNPKDEGHNTGFRLARGLPSTTTP